MRLRRVGDGERRPNYFGTVAADSPSVMAKRLEPLVKYLSARLGLDIQARPAPNMARAIADFVNGTTQIAFLTPAAYVEVSARLKVVPIALPLTHDKMTFNLAIVTRQDSSIHSVSDLRNRSFAFGDEKSLLQRATLEAEGIMLGDLATYAFLKHFDNVAKAVLNHDFDAGIMTESRVRQYKGLRVLHLSPPLPTYVVAVNEDFPPGKVVALRAALTALDPHAAGDIALVRTLDPEYTRFVPATDRDFDVARMLLAPYRKSFTAP